MILAPDVRNRPMCAGVLIIDADKVLFTIGAQHRWRVVDSRVHIPVSGVGGGQEPGETMQECAAREAIEEIGCEVQLLHSSVTYIEIDADIIRTEQFQEKPAPILYQVQRRRTSEPYAPGLPAGDRLHVGIYRAIPTAQPRPCDIPGLLWVPLHSISTLAKGVQLTQVDEEDILISVTSILPEQAMLFIPKPSAEDLLWRVVERFGTNVVRI